MLVTDSPVGMPQVIEQQSRLASLNESINLVQQQNFLKDLQIAQAQNSYYHLHHKLKSLQPQTHEQSIKRTSIACQQASKELKLRQMLYRKEEDVLDQQRKRERRLENELGCLREQVQKWRGGSRECAQAQIRVIAEMKAEMRSRKEELVEMEMGCEGRVRESREKQQIHRSIERLEQRIHTGQVINRENGSKVNRLKAKIRSTASEDIDGQIQEAQMSIKALKHQQLQVKNRLDALKQQLRLLNKVEVIGVNKRSGVSRVIGGRQEKGNQYFTAPVSQHFNTEMKKKSIQALIDQYEIIKKRETH